MKSWVVCYETDYSDGPQIFGFNYTREWYADYKCYMHTLRATVYAPIFIKNLGWRDSYEGYHWVDEFVPVYFPNCESE